MKIILKIMTVLAIAFTFSVQPVQAKSAEELTMDRAIAVVRKVTKKSDSKKTKLRKVYRWMFRYPYKMYRSFVKAYSADHKGWVTTYANDIFLRKGGDCHSTAAALAYLAVAIGYKDVYCVCNNVPNNHNKCHSWTIINGRCYDNLFSEARNFNAFYNVSPKTYEQHLYPGSRVLAHPRVRVKIPYQKKKTEKLLIRKGMRNGFIKNKGQLYYYRNGRPLRSSWLTYKGKKYYFKRNGQAAIGSIRIKKIYYVFNQNGVLPLHKKKVTVHKVTYGVRSNGQALKGLHHHRYYYDNGELMKASDYLHGRFVMITRKGYYDAGKSKKVNALAKAKAPVRDLIASLGHYRHKSQEDSCNAGYVKDIIYEFKNFNVTASSKTDGTEYYFGTVSTHK